MTFEEFESVLNKAVKSSYGKLDIPGYSKENDPVHALTLTDFSVPADEKFNIMYSNRKKMGKTFLRSIVYVDMSDKQYQGCESRVQKGS